jgi:hypothetical protein
MHGEYNVKFSDAQQARTVYRFQRLKERLHKTNAAVWFKKICRHNFIDGIITNIDTCTLVYVQTKNDPLKMAI